MIFIDDHNSFFIEKEKLTAIPFFKTLFSTSVPVDKQHFRVSNLNIVYPLLDFLIEGKLNWSKYDNLYFPDSCHYMSLWLMDDNIYMAQLHYLCKYQLKLDLSNISYLHQIFHSRDISNEHYQNNLKWMDKYFASLIISSNTRELEDSLFSLLPPKYQIKFLVEKQEYNKLLNYDIKPVINCLLKSNFPHYYCSLFRRHLKRDGGISWTEPDITKTSSLVIKNLQPFTAEMYVNLGKITKIKNNVYSLKLEVDLHQNDLIFDGNRNFNIKILHKNIIVETGYSFGLYQIVIVDKFDTSCKLFKFVSIK